MTRVAVVGLGAWGNKILATLETCEGIEVVPVAREAPVCADADAAIIATPSSRHAASAAPYIKMGIPVFIEKPMTVTVKESMHLEAMSLEYGSAIFVGHVYLFHPAFLALVENLDAIHKVRALRFTGRSIQGRDDGDPLLDWLPHGLSLAFRVIGDKWPSSALAVSAVTRHGFSGEYAFSDIPFQYEVGWFSEKKEMKFEVIGERGSLVFDDMSPAKLTHESHGVLSQLAYASTPPLHAELEAFLRVVRGVPVPSGVRVSDGVQISKYIDEAKQLLRHQAVAL